jgi:hypothetical protein
MPQLLVNCASAHAGRGRRKGRGNALWESERGPLLAICRSAPDTPKISRSAKVRKSGAEIVLPRTGQKYGWRAAACRSDSPSRPQTWSFPRPFRGPTSGLRLRNVLRLGVVLVGIRLWFGGDGSFHPIIRPFREPGHENSHSFLGHSPR